MKISKSQVINGVFFVAFTLFAILQINDPDPIIWVTLYAGVAIISLIGNFRTVPRKFIYALFFGYLIFAAYHFLYFIDFLQIDNKEELFGEMVYEKPYLEGTREFFGLVLAAFALLFQLKKKS